jgi:hypothetical protein
MKILHAPTNVGNQPWVLSRHERNFGHQSDVMVNYGTWLEYPADECMGTYGDRTIMNIIKRAYFGFTSPFKYDVIHYNFGRSLLFWDDWPKTPGFPFLDLRIAKRLGKPIFMTLQGCDVRIAGESNKRNAFTPCASGACTAYEACLGSYDSQRRALVENILPLCDKVFFLNPELGHYVPKGTFLPYSNVDINSLSCVSAERPANKIPRIIHAPSNGAIKGTSFILEALEQLKRSYEFELVLVQGLPHKEAMKIYESADIAIDQILAGWYGGVAVELMAMSIPVLSYIRPEDLHFVPKAMAQELPIKSIRPDNLVSDLAKILDSRADWVRWGRESRAFVERWHNPSIIASAMIDAYKNPTSSWDLEAFLI